MRAASPSTPSSRPRNRRRPLTATAISILTLVAGIALEIRAPHQRPVDAGRRHFKPVGAIDRIGDVEHRRQRARDYLAVLDLHRAVRPFGHDLHGAAGEPRNLHPHQSVAAGDQDRLGDRRYPRRHALLDDQARLGIRPGCRSLRSFARSAARPFNCHPGSTGPVGPAFGNKKERVPGEPTLKSRSDHIRPL